MAELVSLLYLALFVCSGLGVARLLFYRERPLRRVWLGLVFGFAMLLWFPALFSFAIGFVLRAQMLALSFAVTIGGVCWSLSP